MYFGHYAVAAAIKAKEPGVPALPILFGVCFLDLLNAAFILVGINTITANPEALPYLYFDLTFIDWDHSLLMAIVWSLVWGAFFYKSKKVAAVAALAAFSHIVTDWPMHNSDLALFPYSNIHLGLGLWGTLGIWSWVLEILFSAALLGYAWVKTKRSGGNLVGPMVFIAFLAVQLNPWLSPLKFVATFSEPYASLTVSVLLFFGFLFPSLILIRLYARMEANKRKA